MNPVLYIILNQELSPGKAASQAAHAAVEGYRISMSTTPDGRDPVYPHLPARTLYETNDVRLWYKGGHYTKIVLGTYGDLRSVSEYLHMRDFNNALIIDEGRTEIAPFTPTAIGCAIVDKNDPHVQATFGEFPLYKAPPVSLNTRDAENWARFSGWTPPNSRTRFLADTPEYQKRWQKLFGRS